MRYLRCALFPLVLVACTDQPTAVSEADGQIGLVFSNGAVHNLPDPECGVIDGNGDLVFPLNCKQAISTYSANGNAVIRVEASGVPNPTGTAVFWDAYNPGRGFLAIWAGVLDDPPIPCGLYATDGETFLFTLKWRGVVSASGEASFTCWYSTKWEFQWP